MFSIIAYFILFTEKRKQNIVNTSNKKRDMAKKTRKVALRYMAKDIDFYNFVKQRFYNIISGLKSGLLTHRTYSLEQLPRTSNLTEDKVKLLKRLGDSDPKCNENPCFHYIPL